MTHTISTVELVFFRGCPNVGQARENLRTALDRRRFPPEWTEWELDAPDLPDRLRGYASPTVLVDGHDVTGEDPGSLNVEAVGVACRADGPPSIRAILAALGSG